MKKIVITSLLLLVTFLYVEGLTFEFPLPNSEEDDTTPDPEPIMNDPRCQNREDGLYPNEQNCNAFYTCNNGVGQDVLCPEGMTFHPQRLCTFRENSACKRNGESALLGNNPITCPSVFGRFPNPEDCKSFINCHQYVPEVVPCPDDMWYMPNVGCVQVDGCPQNA